MVVDRLQAAHNARLPLSGNRLPDASQALACLARTLHVPVLAIVDSDDPTLLGLLDADILVTLAPYPGPSQVQVTVAERDFGTIGSAYLRPDLLHARFLDAEAARKPCDGAGGGQGALRTPPAPSTGCPPMPPRPSRPAHRGGKSHNDSRVESLGPCLASAFQSVTHLPDTAEGRRLAHALRAYDPSLLGSRPALKNVSPAPAARTEQPSATTRPSLIEQPTADIEQVPNGGGEDDAWVQPGDEEDQPGTVFPALNILKDCMGRSTTTRSR